MNPEPENCHTIEDCATLEEEVCQVVELALNAACEKLKTESKDPKEVAAQIIGDASKELEKMTFKKCLAHPFREKMASEKNRKYLWDTSKRLFGRLCCKKTKNEEEGDVFSSNERNKLLITEEKDRGYASTTSRGCGNLFLAVTNTNDHSSAWPVVLNLDQCTPFSLSSGQRWTTTKTVTIKRSIFRDEIEYEVSPPEITQIKVVDEAKLDADIRPTCMQSGNRGEEATDILNADHSGAYPRANPGARTAPSGQASPNT
jgi:hypothetical protein